MKAVSWLKDNITALLAGLVALGGIVLGIIWHRQRVSELKDANAVAVAQNKVAALDARREVLAEREEEFAEELVEVDKARVSIKREIVEVEKEVEGLSDDEVEAEFAKLF